MFQGKWGESVEESETEEARRVEFVKTFIARIRSRLRLLTDSYQVSLTLRSGACKIIYLLFVSFVKVNSVFIPL